MPAHQPDRYPFANHRFRLYWAMQARSAVFIGEIVNRLRSQGFHATQDCVRHAVNTGRVAYAGLNVCLPNLMLRLSPGESNTLYIALYFTVTGLGYAASTIVSGALLDRLGDFSLTL
jgi:hypothetical protein